MIRKSRGQSLTNTRLEKRGQDSPVQENVATLIQIPQTNDTRDELIPNYDSRDAATNTALLPGLVSLQELDKLERKNRKWRFDLLELFEEETDDDNDKKKIK